MIVTFTQGANTYTTEERILKVEHTEEPFSHKTKLLLDNSDNGLTDQSLEGFKTTLGFGITTEEGKYHEKRPPLWIIGQQLESSEGKLVCVLECIGMPNMIAEDRASEVYMPGENDTKTVKAIIQDMFAGTMTAYNHCPTYEVVFDSEDDLIDSYQPRDSFRIYRNGSRLAALRRLLDYTKCVVRFDNDGKIHIFVPKTTPSTDYDYEYSLAEGSHTFFAKAHRKRLVLPNKIVVRSRVDDDPQYSGEAVDIDSYNALGFYQTQFEEAYLTINQAAKLAAAMLSKYQMWAEAGSGYVPLNIFARVYDYVKITDARQGDTRTGNVGTIKFTADATKKYTEWSMNFSFGGWLSVRRLMNDLETYPSGLDNSGASFQRLYAKDGYIENLWIDHIKAIWLDPVSNIDLSKIGDTIDNLPDGVLYARVKSLHIAAGQIKLDENIFYQSGYNPTTKFDLGLHDFDNIPEGTVYRRTKSAALTADGLIILDNVVVGTYGLVKDAYISAGRILLSETTKDGTWYKTGGVKIDASAGITIYGLDRAFRTRATEFGTDQCYMDSSGRICAGAGSVRLGSGGVSIIGTLNYLKFENPADTVIGYIYATTGRIQIDSATGKNMLIQSGDNLDLKAAAEVTLMPGIGSSIKCYRDIFPTSHEAFASGASDAAWSQVVGKLVYSSDGQIHIYQHYDDLAILKGLKTKKNKDGRDALDASSLPSDLYVENEKGQRYVNLGGLQGLSLGMMTALLGRIEETEAKVDSLRN